MQHFSFTATGFLAPDKREWNEISLSACEENGHHAIFAKADAKVDFFDPELACEIAVSVSKEIEGFVAVHLYSPWLCWCKPFFGTDLKTVPKNTQLLLLKHTDGTFSIVLPVCGDKYKTVLEGGEAGLSAKVFSWYDKLSEMDTLCFVYGTGKNPYVLVHDLMKYAVSLLGNYIKMREDRPYPEIFEYLGWCSWDAFMIWVTEGDMVTKCKEFADKDIPVRWAIFDDMWGDVKNFVGKEIPSRSEMFRLMHSSALDSFEAAPERFPHGLANCISEMREQYGMVSGIWHPSTGYWRGVTPEGPIYKAHPELFMEKELEGIKRYAPGFSKEQFFGFYDAFHSFLKSCGTSFMKVDNQSSFHMWYKGLAPIGEIARNFHYGLEKSLYKHFDGNLINCMGMASENIWNRPQTAVSRCSGDFQPENRDWFINHILQCSFNSFYQGQLLWCDWDMWWTDDTQAMKNSVVRAISGGPIYVSDTKNRSNAPILKPLCLYDGRILRCDTPAMPTADCLIANAEIGDSAFKIFSNCGDTYYIAAFDITRTNVPVNCSVSLADLFADPNEKSYVITERFTNLRSVLDASCGYRHDTVLENQDDIRLYCLTPLTDGFAYLGLCDKFIGKITATDITPDGFTLREKGNFEFCSERKVNTVTIDGEAAEFVQDGIFCKVQTASEKRSAVVQISYESC